MARVVGSRRQFEAAYYFWLITRPSLRWASALLLAGPVGVPLVYLLWQAGQADAGELWNTLQRLNILNIIWQVLGLALFSTLWAMVLAVPWAWLVARTDLPGRRYFGWLAPLPLAIPPYVGALAYTTLLTPGGIFHGWLAGLAGVKTFQYPFPDVIHGLGGAAFVLGSFCSPYIYTNLHSALQRIDPSLEEAARSLGHNRWQVFWGVSFPMLRPTLTAGGLLVFLYACVDFGVVSLLRFQTFTTLIYNYLLAGFNLAASAGLCLVLVGLVWLVLMAQRRALGQARYTKTRLQPPAPVQLGWWKWPAFGFLSLAVWLTLLLPLGVLIYQVSRFSSFEALSSFVSGQFGFAANSLILSLSSASLIIILATIVGRLRWKTPLSRSARFTDSVLQAGYAIPGTVLGLSLVGISLNILPAIYGTPLVLLLAYLVLFCAPALQSVRAAFAAVNPVLEEAARSLGLNGWRATLQVMVPLSWPGLVGGWLLVFVLSLRELAATIILRPAGFDTLAVRVWVHTSDVGPDPGSAVSALILVLIAGLAWILILSLGKTPKIE